MSDNSYNEQENGKEFITTRMTRTEKRNSLSKKEILYNAPELEVSSEYSKEERVLNETPGSPTSKTSKQCKRSDDEDVKHIM
jgi:hypothetical protein